ncbi:hypothetical protein VTN02DRAFT_4533 [Thermoascus thermophilus]
MQSILPSRSRSAGPMRLPGSTLRKSSFAAGRQNNINGSWIAPLVPHPSPAYRCSLIHHLITLHDSLGIR